MLAVRTCHCSKSASGVRSVDFTLKYTGQIIWVRPWGGPANGKWIPFVMEGIFSAPRFTGVLEEK